MIGVLFLFGSEPVEVRVDQKNVYFRTGAYGGQFSTIEGLKLSKAGVIKEHPDLKDNDDWREEAIKRFKKKISSYKTEKQRMDYLIKDLTKFGYVARYMQKPGHRPIKL